MKTTYKNYTIAISGNDEDGFSYHVTGGVGSKRLNFSAHDFISPEFAEMEAQDMIDGLI